MATDIYAAQFGEVRTASTAAGGTALTTTAGYIVLPKGTNWLSLTPRNLVTAAVVKYALNPYLVVLKTTDSLATVANLTDGSENLQDADASTTLVMNDFPTLASGGRLYVGSHLPSRGVRVTIGNTNSHGGSALTVKYWQSATPNAWTSITPTDGTLSTDTFRQTGNVTWTVPTDWLKKSLLEISDDLADPNRSGGALTAELSIARNMLPASCTTPMFWTRWETSAVFDPSVTVTGMTSMNRNTAQYGEMVDGQTLEMLVRRGPGGIALVEALTDAGTANLIVNVATRGSDGGFAS